MKIVDLTNRRFGRLVALYIDGHQGKLITWRCQCDCGNQTSIIGASLRHGKTRSCGCLQRELTAQRLTRHGHRLKNVTDPTYMSWYAMIARCTNPRHRRFKDYSGRGIKVCNRWRFGEKGKNGFECFLEDVGERPEGKTLDRYPDNDGNYEPGNFRWATYAEQRANARRPGAKFTDRIGKLTAGEAPDSAAFTLTTVAIDADLTPERATLLPL